MSEIVFDSTVIGNVGSSGRVARVVVLPDGRVFRVGAELAESPEAAQEERGDGIVEAARRNWHGQSAPEGAELTEPPFKHGEVLLPDGTRDDPVRGPWGAYKCGEAEWRPWDSLRSRFEQRTYLSVEACDRRCWYLNGLEQGAGLAGWTLPPEKELAEVERNLHPDDRARLDAERVAGISPDAARRAKMIERELHESQDRLDEALVSLSDQQKYGEEDPKRGKATARLREAVWEAWQHFTPDEIHAKVAATLIEIEADTA